MAADDGSVLPRSDASLESLRAVGLVMLKCVLDDHPITGLCSIVFDFLVYGPSASSFNSPEQALRKLAEYDPQLAAAWRTILLEPAQREGLSLYDFDGVSRVTIGSSRLP